MIRSTTQRSHLHNGLLAEAYGHARQPQAGLDVLADALATAEGIDERWYMAELRRLKGELPLACSETHALEAETCFHEALETARRHRAKSLKRRAAVSLARLWRWRGQGSAAYDVLADTYRWFAEGFDTPD